MSNVQSFLPDIWSGQIVSQLKASTPWLPEPTAAERAWLAHCNAHRRYVELSSARVNVDDACASLVVASEGLQNASVDWGDEMCGPTVEGFVAGTICEHPSGSGPCPLLLGHGGDHA